MLDGGTFTYHRVTAAPLPGMICQRDPLWAHDTLGQPGSSPYTIGGAGCALCCLSMLSRTPPSQLNRLLVAAGAFSEQKPGEIVWERITGVAGLRFAAPRYEWSQVISPEALETLLGQIAVRPLPIKVDFAPATSQLDQHWVLAYAMTANRADLWIADPWFGTYGRLLLSPYARPTWTLSRAIWGARDVQMETGD